MSMSAKAQNRADRAERAAEHLRRQRAQERRRNALVVGGVVLAMILVIGAGFLVNSLRDSSQDISASPAGATDHGVAIGDPDAPHQVVIYEDFLCPYCGQLEQASSEELTRLADEGKVYVDYRPFNLLRSDYSVDAANAFAVVLDAAGPKVAKTFHDELFADQPAEGGPYPDADWLVAKAVEAGAAEADVRPGIEDGAQEQWVADATSAAADAGVSSTPTLLLDGQFYQDGRTMQEIADNLVAALE
ncbi:membrane protein [Nocardioides psychrotolerans]|uniref:Protein-disulfide isomerase n=2 Tax=Nocardioides psychrotolerans TaxID=1005945 RepID=A0A1I3LU56_9ACTN|nr:membrane protein [Nocardioides psychrotolerans]SFI87986.1 Protein-disulfide isomerase [Nocardioides psychrotolerans]